MEPLKVSEIVAATGGRLVQGEDGVVTGISIDTRTLKPGDLYVAIRGKRLDGHEFIPQALERGAMGAVRDAHAQAQAGVVVEVGNTTEALGRIAAYYRGRLEVKVVAVTGSNGKTTTKEMLAAILNTRFRTLKPESSFNNDIGVPLTVLRMDRSTEAAIFEIEMNELGGTERLARICRPEVGIITNIGDTHLEFMRDRYGVAREKGELLEVLPTNGHAVLNADDHVVVEIGDMYGHSQRVMYGVEKRAEVFADRVVDMGLEGTSFCLQGQYPVTLPMPGKHNVGNCLAACAAAYCLGIDYEEMPSALAGFAPPPMRLRVIRLKNVVLVEDCYNANPQSMWAALELLRDNGRPGHRIAFLGDMLELGAQSVYLHRTLGHEAANIVDRLVVVGPMGEFVRQGAIETRMSPESVYRFASSGEALSGLVDLVKSGDTILVKGSRAMAMELVSQEIQKLYGRD